MTLKVTIPAYLLVFVHLVLGIFALYNGENSSSAHLFFFLNTGLFGCSVVILFVSILLFVLYRLAVSLLEIDETKADYSSKASKQSFVSKIVAKLFLVVRIILIIAMAASAWYWSAAFLLASVLLIKIGAYFVKDTDFKLVTAKAQEIKTAQAAEAKI